MIGIPPIPKIILTASDWLDRTIVLMMSSLGGGSHWLLKGGVLCACNRGTRIGLWNNSVNDYQMYHTLQSRGGLNNKELQVAA